MLARDAASLSIGELSARTGVSVRALRHYEQNGLLTATREGAGHRRFDSDAVETVRRIRLFLDTGLPIAVVSQVMTCFVDGGARLDGCVAAYLREHMDAIRERIDALDRRRDALSRLQQLVVV
ncbi:MerR family transcriptional regulator [Microbacterium sp. SORGH_AS_0888]|uniref:MerR family transcriptional regulator n=1 Tax=Microbacterium sp. SORGH_AS_0888 TaxID=3041791 RepID=UPI0027818D07|nr:MerR family transcriptional regulator [Microbacterium sp. SORGH_AS_0888]MDQ1128332.1 DNA-binding transcriptional MerR regulator [Microbacterium sp. SORGH_AS_0888]